MRYLFILSFFLLISACSSESPEDKGTTEEPAVSTEPETTDHRPEIDIPGLGIDHDYVADELIKEDVNYREIYSVSEENRIRDILSKLESIERPLETRQDTMVHFSIHALSGTLYSRMAQANPGYFNDMKRELTKAIALVDDKPEYKLDRGFEKLAMASMHFMQDNIDEGVAMSKELIEDYQDLHIPEQRMYIARSGLVTYFQMMHALADMDDRPDLLTDAVAYLENISEENNELGREAARMLYQYYNQTGQHDRAGEMLRKAEAGSSEMPTAPGGF